MVRKGALCKERNYLKNSIDWERFSASKGRWVKTRAYLYAHDPKTFAGMVEGNAGENGPNFYDVQFRFPTIEAAFEWAENRVDYKTISLRKIE